MFHTVACSICLGMQQLNITEVRVHILQYAIRSNCGFLSLLLNVYMNHKQYTLMLGHIACMV